MELFKKVLKAVGVFLLAYLLALIILVIVSIIVILLTGFDLSDPEHGGGLINLGLAILLTYLYYKRERQDKEKPWQTRND